MLPLALLSEVSPLASRSAPLAVVKEREEGGEVWMGDALSWVLAAAFYCKKWKGVMTKSQMRCQARCALRQFMACVCVSESESGCSLLPSSAR